MVLGALDDGDTNNGARLSDLGKLKYKVPGSSVGWVEVARV